MTTPTPPAPKQAEAFTFGMEKVPATDKDSLTVASTPHPWIWEFLDGSAGYMGVWYGERHPDHSGLFWWRKFLRAELTALLAQAAATDAEIERLRADAERTERNRDMWKGQCERQAAQLTAMRTALIDLHAVASVAEDKDYWVVTNAAAAIEGTEVKAHG